VPTFAVKALIRSGEFARIAAAMETGADNGMWTWHRYQTWLEKRTQWHIADANEQAEAEPAVETDALPPLSAASSAQKTLHKVAKPAPTSPTGAPSRTGRPIEIEPVEGGLTELIKKLEG
jgi:twitching motility protein PilT